MRIQVAKPDGSKIFVIVNGSDTVEVLRAKILWTLEVEFCFDFIRFVTT
jgi:hypothetical protein